MNKDTGTLGAPRPHIDTLVVVHGHAFRAAAVETIALGSRPTGEADAFEWLYLPAGRGV